MGHRDPFHRGNPRNPQNLTSSTMPPFRNFLGRKSQPNGDTPALDDNYLSPNQGPAPIPIRNSQDEPTEYKLSGMFESPHCDCCDCCGDFLSCSTNLGPQWSTTAVSIFRYRLGVIGKM